MEDRITCKICGSKMYSTDFGHYETTYHCSSEEARFWDYDRGSKAQSKAKEHWDASKKDIERKQA